MLTRPLDETLGRCVLPECDSDTTNIVIEKSHIPVPGGIVAGIGSNVFKGPDISAVSKTVESIGHDPVIDSNKPYVSILKDESAPVYGVAKVSVVDTTKTVNDACRSVLGLRRGSGETPTFENEFGLLTTFGKANFI